MKGVESLIIQSFKSFWKSWKIPGLDIWETRDRDFGKIPGSRDILGSRRSLVTTTHTRELLDNGNKFWSLNYVIYVHYILFSSVRSSNSHPNRVILIWRNFKFWFLHGFKLFHLVSDFQNSFCFWCTTLPSAVRKIFRLQWEFQWVNDQNK